MDNLLRALKNKLIKKKYLLKFSFMIRYICLKLFQLRQVYLDERGETDIRKKRVNEHLENQFIMNERFLRTLCIKKTLLNKRIKKQLKKTVRK